MLKFSSVFIFSEDPKKLSEFYKKVFEEKPVMEDSGYTGFLVGNCHIVIGPHDKVHGKNTTPERIFINLETTEVEKEFERIASLGAEVISKPYHPMEGQDVLISTFADPDGNYFQLTSPMPEM